MGVIGYLSFMLSKGFRFEQTVLGEYSMTCKLSNQKLCLSTKFKIYPPRMSKNLDGIEAHIVRRYDIQKRLGKGVN